MLVCASGEWMHEWNFPATDCRRRTLSYRGFRLDIAPASLSHHTETKWLLRSLDEYC